MTTDAIVVPLKRFDLAKDRLRQAAKLDVTRLAEDLALGVLRSSSPRHVIVLSESDEISRFADAHGAEAWRSEAHSLNEAVQGAYVALRERFDRLIIVHGDLARPEGLGRFAPGPGVTIVADHHRAGTNVLVVPTGLDFHFAYGPDSLRLHHVEAERLGVSCAVLNDSPWRFDVDEPGDLGLPPDSI
jgi:2-phospho-L-lactate guanylyltransferase